MINNSGNLNYLCYASMNGFKPTSVETLGEQFFFLIDKPAREKIRVSKFIEYINLEYSKENSFEKIVIIYNENKRRQEQSNGKASEY